MSTVLGWVGFPLTISNFIQVGWFRTTKKNSSLHIDSFVFLLDFSLVYILIVGNEPNLLPYIGYFCLLRGISIIIIV